VSPWTAQILGRELEIVRKNPGQKGFQARPKRWAVERTLSWSTGTGVPAEVWPQELGSAAAQTMAS
jgi:hypothetical protein